MGNLVTPRTQLASHPASNVAPITFTPEEEQKCAAQWALADEIIYGSMPDPQLNEVGWMQRIHHRLTAFLVKHNHVNETRAKTVVDEIKAIIRERQHYDVDYAFELARLEVGKNRIGQMPKTTGHHESIQLGPSAKIPAKKSETKPAPTKATDDTDAKVTILLSALTDLEKEFHRDGEDNSVLRGSLYDGYPKVKEPFDLVRLSNYDLEEVKWRYRNILTARADVPVKTTLDEVDKSIEALPPTVANDLPKRDLAASVSPDLPIVTMANATDPRTYAKMDRATMTNDLPKSDKASDWFPRCPSCNDALVDGKCTNPACPALFAKTGHWIEIPEERFAFFGHLRPEWYKYRPSAMFVEEDRLNFIHKALKVNHIKETKLDRDAAEKEVIKHLYQEFGNQQNDLTPNDADQAAEVFAKETSDKPAETSTTSQPEQAPIASTPISGIPTAAPQNQTPSCPEKVANSNGVEKAITIAPVPMTSPVPMPDMSRWDVMRQQATVMIKSGFLPQSIKTPEQALTIMMMGDALGVQPIVALNNINVIQGKPTVSPQLQLALIRRSGLLEAFKVTDDGETCTVVIKRKGEAEHTETFSQKDAAAMGLSNKDNWRKQPATMRRWRAISAACRLLFSDIVWGIAAYTSEEIDPDYVIEAA